MGKSQTTLTVKGTRGDDELNLPAGAPITKVLVDGNAGSDTLDLSNYGSGVTVHLESGMAKASSMVADRPFTGLFPNAYLAGAQSVRGTMKNVENLIGTDFNDFLFVNITNTAKYVDGGGGNDVVESLGGNATLVGGTGSDWLVGYWPNVTLIGGTYVNGQAQGDGETDYFYLGSGSPTILDFEVGIDKLICEFASASIEAGTWQSNGSGGSMLMVNGVAEVILANVDVATAQTIELGYALLPVNGHVEGSSGDDLLFVGHGARIHLGSNSGNDATVSFDILEDILLFEDGVTPTWSDTIVNGAEALLGSWEGGSITIQGLGTDDVPNLIIEGVSSDPTYGAPGPGPWSNDDDYASIGLIG